MMSDLPPPGVPGIFGRDGDVVRLSAALARPGVTVVRGIAGSGRSTLLRLAARGRSCVSVRGARGERLQPGDGVDHLLIAAGSERPGRTSDPATVAEHLVQVASGRSLIVDDVVWWDSESRAVLALAARLPDAPSVLLGTDVSDALTDFAGADILDLAPLATPDARALLAQRAPELSRLAVDRVVESAAGNPLALVEMGGSSTPGEAPMLLRSFSRRTDDLDRPTLDALVLLALATDRSGRLPDAEIHQIGVDADVLEQGRRAGLLESTRDGVAFVHPVARTALCRLATSAERRAAEARLAERRSDPHERLRHAAGSRVTDDPDLVARLERAAMEATSPARSAELLESAAPRAGVRRGELLVRAAEFRLDARDDADVPDLLTRARRTSIDAGIAARATLVEAAIGIGERHPAELFRSLIDALPALASDPEKHRRAEHIALELALWAGRSDWIDQLSGEMASDDAFRGPARDFARVLRGEPASRLRHVAMSPLDDEDALVVAAGAAIFTADSRRAAEVVAELERCGTAAPWGAVSVQALLALGHWHGARLPHTREADGTTWGVALALGARAHSAAAAGDVAGCLEAAAEAKRLAVGAELPFAAALAQWALGRLSLQEGDSASALTLFARIVEPGSESFHRAVAVLVVPDLLEAAERQGERDRFAPWRERLAGADSEWAGVVLARVDALLHSDGSEQAFAEAIRRAVEAGEQFEEARVRLLAGEQLRRGRQRVRAREELVAARELFQSLGAERWAARALRELDATSASVRRDPDGAGLTPRERQIADLVATGASNQEIAVRLAMSRKTVEYHLHKTYSKLGIGNRAELADILGSIG
jgi:DNA-binding NarL/FixJ family response regulator